MKKKITIIINLLISFFIFIFFAVLSTKKTILIDRRTFDFFHLASEIIVSMASCTIFYIGWYTFPYEKKQKYIIPSSIFLSISLINILHIHFALQMDSWGISILFANITYILLSIAIILLNKLPENHVAKDRKHFFIFP